ncbi:hypothetical protein D7030_00840 [Flavobacteriaceae bacterium AU392]|nr:hypothetical protein D1817_03085 [Flavobacteriaceae bacterium]RKM86604.1 hypothetical protein D7030_00840 [Flavobacteriaceae bacterium AU392]
MRLLTLFIILPIVLNAQIKAYPIDSWHSRIEFNVKFSGLLPVKGQFTAFEGTVLLNEKDMTKTSATLLIDGNSIDTGVNLRDNHLKGEDFFEVEKYPQIVFSSKRVVHKEGQFIMIGDLNMHNVTREVEVPIQLLHGEQLDTWKNFRITLKGKFQINRSDFDIGNNQPTIGQMVTIEFIISARIFNTETIALFNRPFGKKMIKAILEEGKEKAYSQYKELVKNKDEDTSKASSFEHLYQYLRQNNHLKASIEITKLFTEIFPKEPQAYSLLGDAYFQNNLYKEAKLAFEKAISYDDKNTLAYEMLKLLD